VRVVGLCGRSGSGKGAVCDIFARYGIPSVDTDAIYREMTEKPSPCLRALCEHFGEQIIKNDGSLDRAALREKVFSGEKAAENREILNRISHKFILDKTREIIAEHRKNGVSAILIDAPLLFESGFDKECDLVVAVVAEEEERLRRIAKRDGISLDAAKMRIKTQLSDEILKERSDHVIVNCGDLANLSERVKEVAEVILNKTEKE